MVSLALDLGAIPTYPVLGNPVTSPWEEDLPALFDRLESLGIPAIEVIPNRNARERLLAIVTEAERRGVPVLNGTEHNTKSPLPLVDRFFFDRAFRPHFERGGGGGARSSGAQGARRARVRRSGRGDAAGRSAGARGASGGGGVKVGRGASRCATVERWSGRRSTRVVGCNFRRSPKPQKSSLS